MAVSRNQNHKSVPKGSTSKDNSLEEEIASRFIPSIFDNNGERLYRDAETGKLVTEAEKSIAETQYRARLLHQANLGIKIEDGTTLADFVNDIRGITFESRTTGKKKYVDLEDDVGLQGSLGEIVSRVRDWARSNNNGYFNRETGGVNLSAEQIQEFVGVIHKYGGDLTGASVLTPSGPKNSPVIKLEHEIDAILKADREKYMSVPEEPVKVVYLPDPNRFRRAGKAAAAVAASLFTLLSLPQKAYAGEVSVPDHIYAKIMEVVDKDKNGKIEGEEVNELRRYAQSLYNYFLRKKKEYNTDLNESKISKEEAKTIENSKNAEDRARWDLYRWANGMGRSLLSNPDVTFVTETEVQRRHAARASAARALNRAQKTSESSQTQAGGEEMPFTVRAAYVFRSKSREIGSQNWGIDEHGLELDITGPIWKHNFGGPYSSGDKFIAVGFDLGYGFSKGNGIIEGLGSVHESGESEGKASARLVYNINERLRLAVPIGYAWGSEDSNFSYGPNRIVIENGWDGFLTGLDAVWKPNDGFELKAGISHNSRDGSEKVEVYDAAGVLINTEERDVEGSRFGFDVRPRLNFNKGALEFAVGFRKDNSDAPGTINDWKRSEWNIGVMYYVNGDRCSPYAGLIFTPGTKEFEGGEEDIRDLLLTCGLKATF